MTEEIFKQYVLSKKFTCNVCDNDFYANISRMTKLKFISSDEDLHPNYEPMDPLLYDVLICPLCGYSAMTMFFNKFPEKQISLIRMGVTSKFRPRSFNEIMSYEDALEKYKLALITAMVRGAKKGEIGYICTKIAWIYRLLGKEDSYKGFANKAASEFELAYQEENFPICQMDESTLGYLIAYFMFISGRYDGGLRWTGRVVTNRNISSRLKERCIDLKTKTMERIKTH